VFIDNDDPFFPNGDALPLDLANEGVGGSSSILFLFMRTTFGVCLGFLANVIKFLIVEQ
jgi:hypothetical protein